MAAAPGHLLPDAQGRADQGAGLVHRGPHGRPSLALLPPGVVLDLRPIRARILPSVGPADGVGIYTGCILAISGTWDEVEPEPEGLESSEGQP